MQYHTKTLSREAGSVRALVPVSQMTMVAYNATANSTVKNALLIAVLPISGVAIGRQMRWFQTGRRCEITWLANKQPRHLKAGYQEPYVL